VSSDLFCLSRRHVSGAPGWGTGNVTVKVMHRNGTLEPGEIHKELGYVSILYYIIIIISYLLNAAYKLTSGPLHLSLGQM